MAGCFMGLCLAKKGYDITIYEDRPDVRKNPYNSGRSFNLTLYYRGILAMKKAGIWNQVKKYAVLARGNVAHYENKKAVYDPFDISGNDVLYTIHRNQLNSTLIDIVEKYPNVKVFFNTRCIKINKSKKTIIFQKNKQEIEVHADIIVGADGVNSVVRSEMQKSPSKRNLPTVNHQYENWGYKEVHVSKQNAEKLKLQKLTTHTWPRPNSLLIAFPNPDSSYTLMFNLPLSGKNSFLSLNSRQKIEKYITANFTDLNLLLPEIVNSFLNKPTGKFVTVHTNPWYYKDFIVLIGDSAHGVIPFYGQGVCAAFDDCLTISSLINTNKNNREEIFREYQLLRKINTDILAGLSKENFIELRDKSRSQFFILKDKTDTFLNRLLPGLWLPPLYVLIAHGTLPYALALKKWQKQGRIARWSGINLVIYIAAFPMGWYQRIKGTLDL